MNNETISAFKNCKDLQSLINITLSDVIKPLRLALKSNPKSKIIELEIKDAENKVFEYIASQITTIGNASEQESNECLKEFPKSDICYRCSRLDEDTIEGLIKIRDISFLSFLEMNSDQLTNLLRKYSISDMNSDAIKDAITIIKQNIDLMYSNSPLFDNTRNLIKLVTRFVDNKSTRDDIHIIGIPYWSYDLYQCELKCSMSNKTADDCHSNLTISNDNIFVDSTTNYTQNTCKCLSNQTVEHRRSVSDCHPSSITSTKKPVNPETLLRAFKSNLVLSGTCCNDEKSYLSTNQFIDINSLSVPNTPNVQKSRSVGGSEEVLNDFQNEKSSAFSNISPTFSRKYYVRSPNSKLKNIHSKNNKLRRSLSHEFESRIIVNCKDSILTNFQNQQVQSAVFQFNQDKINNTIEMERRSSYEEKLIYKNSTMGSDFPRPLSPDFQFSKKNNDTNNGFKSQSSHKFESDNKFGIPNIVKLPICAVCKTKKFFPKLVCCEICKIKVHKSCLKGAEQIACISCPMDRKSSDNSVANASVACQGSDSNSASSCNSSAPGSPFNPESGYISSANNHISPRHPNKRLVAPKFEFSAIVETDSLKSLNSSTNDQSCSTQMKSNNFEQNKLSQRYESTESQDDFSRLSRTNSISVALKEWEIPMENLHLGEVIGKGSFSTVYKGKWHGEVAVKVMNNPQDENDSCMAAFKSEVGTLHKTRHENLVLFMGACMKPPSLAIVTQLSQGETLYSQLHSGRASIPVIRAINIASQVAKGMGYLHAKDILHKDLKSRNIFIESNCKVVISDFGLFDFVRMCKQAISGSYVRIPPGWLCYLAPELLRQLNLNSIFSNNSSEDLPFTKYSDIFAFGTIWYEILNSKWPFEGLPSEAIIYRVGKGIKESMKTIHAKEFKDLLMQCWAFKSENRPPFTNIVQMLEKLPKLQRSPSYPVKSVSIGR